MKKLCAFFLFSLMAISPLANLHAAEAVFSKDGKSIFTIHGSGASNFSVIDLSKKTITNLSLKKRISEPVINSISRDNEGRILCVTNHALWALDPANQSVVKICDAPQDVQFTDVAFDPKTEITLLTIWKHLADNNDADIGAMCLEKGSAKLQPLYMTKETDSTQQIDAPVFAPNGDLYFALNGDLWLGSWTPDRRLESYRIAPLATQTTYADLPFHMRKGVHQIAVAGAWVYLHFTAHAAGPGDGKIMRLKRIPLIENQPADIDGMIPIYQKTLASLESIQDCYMPTMSLCSSPDGSLVYFDNPGAGHQLIINNGKPQPLTLKSLDAK